jgi:O-antigen ligase
MDLGGLIGLLLVLALAAVAWMRPAGRARSRGTCRVSVEELDEQGRVTRHVVL